MRRWSFAVAILILSMPHGGHAASAERTSPPPTAFSAPEMAELDAALGRLAEAIRYKVDQDLDTIGYAFWAVHDIDRARLPADIAGAPLAALQAWLSWMRTIDSFEKVVDAGGWSALGDELLVDATSGTAWLSAAVKLLHFRSLHKAGEDLARGLYGPSYAESIRLMYDEAGRQRSEDAFAAVVKDYLRGQRDVRLLAVVPPEVARERGASGIFSGSSAVVASIEEAIDQRRSRLLALSPGELADEVALAASGIDEFTQFIKRSVFQNLPLGATNDGRPATWLGSIHGLRQMQIDLLGRYAASLRKQQVEVAFSAATSAASGLIEMSLKLGAAEPHAVMTVIDIAELGAGAATWSAEVDVRELLSEVPQSMVWALATELEILWHMVERGLLGGVDDGIAELAAATVSEDEPDAARADQEPVATLRIELDDGTVIVGEVEAVPLQFASAFGNLEIAIGEIAGFIEETLALADGSVLKGRFADGELPVETARGRVDVPANRIIAIASNAAHAAAPRLAPPADSGPELPPGQGLITGRVVDNFDQPVPGAMVRIDGLDVSSQTINDGIFELPYIPGRFSVIVTAPGYRTARISYDIALATLYPAEPIRVVKMPLGEGFFLLGKNGWKKLLECTVHTDRRNNDHYVEGPNNIVQYSDILIVWMPSPVVWNTGSSQFIAYRTDHDRIFRNLPNNSSETYRMREGYVFDEFAAFWENLPSGDFVIVRWDHSRCVWLKISQQD